MNQGAAGRVLDRSGPPRASITSHSLLRWRTLDRIALPAFYALRAARILPLLLAFLVLSVVLAGAIARFCTRPLDRWMRARWAPNGEEKVA
jgi:peptidoglycan/LPS O-acetylase OafA/YrhL